MAAKKRVRTGGPQDPAELKRLRKLARRAHDEVMKLLKRTKDGNITQAELKTGLKDLEVDLDGIVGFHYFKI
jgi:hypothetical protein